MKRINLESFPCKLDLTSSKSSPDFPRHPPLSSPRPSLPTMTISDTSPLAQPTWELVLELPSISTFQNWWRTQNFTNPLPTSTRCKSEVSMENTLRPTTVFSIFPTWEDSEEMRSNSSKTCMTESKPWSKLRNPCDETTHRLFSLSLIEWLRVNKVFVAISTKPYSLIFKI